MTADRTPSAQPLRQHNGFQCIWGWHYNQLIVKRAELVHMVP